MTVEKFDEEVDKVCTSIKDVLSIKAKEYRRNNNPLHNFDVGTQQSTSGETREEVIWGMARKHFISVQDIKNDVKLGKIPNREVLDEKYGDLINYLILEKTSILDKINLDYQNCHSKTSPLYGNVEDIVFPKSVYEKLNNSSLFNVRPTTVINERN